MPTPLHSSTIRLFAMGLSSYSTSSYRPAGVPVASREASDKNVGSFSPPETWTELSSALLDLLMPSNSVDVTAVLSRYRLVAGFEAKTVHLNDEEYADYLASEYFSLICDGPVLSEYQQLPAGTIDWCACRFSRSLR